MTGFIIFAHGSSIESANEAVRAVARGVAREIADSPIETAFLEGGKPDLSEAVNTLLHRGARRIVVVPYFLTLGLHLQRDLPKLLDEVRSAHPELTELSATAPLDGHPALREILVERARSAC